MKTKEDIWMESMFGNTLNSRMATSQPDFTTFPSGYYSTHPGSVIYGVRSLKFLNYKDVRRDRRRAITLILLLGAFFVSFSVAILVFFVVMNGSQEAKFDYHVANVSMPLWNTTWNNEMENVTSDSFKDIALPFCDEIDRYFDVGRYSSQYKGCSVRSLMQYNTTDCECSGILGDKWNPAVLLTFDLLFQDMLTETEIMTSILAQTRAKYSRGYRLLFVGDFLIDITVHSLITPAPLEPGVVEGTYVHARFGLYSFNYTSDLKEVNSPRFQGLNLNFCDNLERFLEYSIISENLGECGILTFREYPPEMDFYLTFALPAGSYIINNITMVLSDIAPGATINGIDIAFVGDLTLILSQSVMTISKVNFTVVTTTTPQTTSSSATASTTTITSSTTSKPTTPTTTSTTTQLPSTPTPSTTTTTTTSTTAMTTTPTTTTTTTMSTTTTTTTTTATTTSMDTTTSPSTKAPVTCSDQPCKNNGYCRDLELGGFFCQCRLGYVGRYCETDVNECLTSPCKNGGSCRNNPGSYMCDCVDGWTGKHCTDSLRECDSGPCGNNGSCIATPGGYLCACTTGWTGTRCFDDINECATVTCSKNGYCVNTDGTFYCQCEGGWTGPLCSTRIDECINNPCANGGSCNNGPTTYFCTCTPGWTGVNCEIDINECNVLIEPCSNGGSCQNVDASYTCHCPPGWQGTYCEQNVNECQTGVCDHAASCIDTDGSYTCICTSGWKGQNCSDDINECSLGMTMCMHGGTCSNNMGGYSCVCPPGRTGLLCSEDVNECLLLTDECMSGSTCQNNQGSYTCQCPPGITGQFCTQNINECQQFPCLNDGTCVDNRGSYTCTCTASWTGQNCEQVVNECSSAPCKNGATCITEPGTYRCECETGLTGTNCDTDINECSSSPCLNGGSCFNRDGTYDCSCLPQNTGRDCEETIYACISNPCANGATCLDSSSGDFTCICNTGWSGDTCIINDNECLTSPCQNGGNCVDTLGSFYCQCPAGYTGKFCGDDIQECLGDPCFNGGTCKETLGSFYCECPAGWEGTLCTSDDNECLTSPCQNGGNCVDTLGSFYCQCPAGYTGKFCGDDIQECLGDPCFNGGTCKETLGSFYCECPAGWEGTLCTSDDNECLTSPCQNGGNCVDTLGSFYCQCPAGYTGKFCGDDIQECLGDPCFNGGTCKETLGSFYCECPAGWEGTLCTSDVNECENVPCNNNGGCINSLGSYACLCGSGWTGPDCSTDIEECRDNPCFNGGTCSEASGSFFCDCPVGWEGDLCTTDVNECDNVPCQHNGGCINSPGSYACVCGSGWTGQNCSIDINECDAMPCGPGSCRNINGSFACDCPVGRTGPTCGQVLRTTFVFFLPVLNRTFSADLSNESSQEFMSLSKSFCDEVETILQSSQQQFPYFYGCNVANFRNNPFIMNVELTFDGNTTVSSLQSARTHLLNKKPALYSGKFGVTLGDLVVEVENYNATKKAWHAHLVNLAFNTSLLDPESVSYKAVDNSLCSDISFLMENSSPFAQNYIGCIVETIQNATNISSSSLATLMIYMEGVFNAGSLEESLSDFLSSRRSLVRFGDYMGHTLGNYIVFSSHYAGYVDVPLTLQVLNQMWTNDLADPRTEAYRQLATPLCTAVTNLILRNSTLAGDFKECKDVRFGETPPVVDLSLRFDSANMTYDVRNLDFYKLIKDSTLQQVYFDYYSRILGPLLVFHSSWGRIAYDAVLIDTEFEFYNIKYVPDHSNTNSAVFKDFQLLFCRDIDAFMAATSLKNRYYGCVIEAIGDTPPHNFTLRTVFNGTDDVTQQEIITAIDNDAPSSTFGDKLIWQIGQELVYLAERSMGQPVNMSDYTTPVPPIIVFTEFIVTFQALNLTYTSALGDRTSAEFSSLARPLREEVNTIFTNKQDMDDFISTLVIEFRENPDEVDVTLIFEGPQVSTMESKITDILLEYARRASSSTGQPAFMIGTLLFDQVNIAIKRSIVYTTNTTTTSTTTSTSTTTTTTPATTSTTPDTSAVPCEDVTSFGEVRVPFPNHCRKYYICFESVAIETECPPGQAFDNATAVSCTPDLSCVD